MTPEDVKQLLASIAGYDGRAVDARTIYDWHAILGEIPYELAQQAIRVWYAENRGYVQPHDIAIAAARLAGVDRAPTVTERRLTNVRAPWELEGLAEPWTMPRVERKSEEND